MLEIHKFCYSVSHYQEFQGNYHFSFTIRIILNFADELQETLRVSGPKLIFCQSDKAPEIQIVLNDLDLSTDIVTFDKGDYLCSFTEFMNEYRDNISTEEFKWDNLYYFYTSK